MNRTPRIAAIHDLSGFGRCSLTIVMPVLSAMGLQCCPLPTAYLSTHTGGFTGNTFLDMTEELGKAMAHWERLGLTFEAIYTGFMGNERQMALAADFIRAVRSPGTIVVVDPVMGDHGKLYRTYTPAMCQAMKGLAETADVIVPNATEAALLLDVPYESLSPTRDGFRRTVEALSRQGRRSVVLTGVSLSEGQTGAACFDRTTGEYLLCSGSFCLPRFPRYRRSLCQRPHRRPGPRYIPPRCGGAGCGICPPLCRPHRPPGPAAPGGHRL